MRKSVTPLVRQLAKARRAYRDSYGGDVKTRMKRRLAAKAEARVILKKLQRSAGALLIADVAKPTRTASSCSLHGGVCDEHNCRCY